MTSRHSIDLVFGVCTPHRRRIAAELGPIPAQLDDDLTPAEIRTAVDHFVAVSAIGDAVIDCPSSASAADLIDHFEGTDGLNSRDEPVTLRRIITVVDASHLLTDLLRDDYYELDLDAEGSERQLVAWALIAVTQIEYASVIVVAGWRHLERDDLDEVLTLLCHLNPRARIRLERRGWQETLLRTHTAPPADHRPGWVQILNGHKEAPGIGRRVVTLRYDRMRPFHPGRLLAALEAPLAAAAKGTIVRSAGVCRFATRLGFPARWDQVGEMISFDPFEDHDSESPQGQEIAFIGFDLDTAAMSEVLDSCLLTDEEFLAGSFAWRLLPDPLPRWVLRE